MPAQTCAKTPAAVVVGHPTKGIIADPCQAAMSRRPITIVVGAPARRGVGNPNIRAVLIAITPVAVVVQVVGIGGDRGIDVFVADAVCHGSTVVGPATEAVGLERVKAANRFRRTHVADIGKLAAVDGLRIPASAYLGKAAIHFHGHTAAGYVDAVDSRRLYVGGARGAVHTKDTAVSVVPLVCDVQKQAALVELENTQAFVVIDLIDRLELEFGSIGDLQKAAVYELNFGVRSSSRFDQIARNGRHVAYRLLLIIAFMCHIDVFVGVSKTSKILPTVEFGLVELIDKDLFGVIPCCEDIKRKGK